MGDVIFEGPLLIYGCSSTDGSISLILTVIHDPFHLQEIGKEGALLFCSEKLNYETLKMN